MQLKITDRKNFFIGLFFALAGAFGVFAGAKLMSHSATVVQDVARANDVAGDTVSSRHGSVDEHLKTGVQEKGEFHVSVTRPCLAGQTDVSGMPESLRDHAKETAPLGICGELSSEVAHNALTYTGQSAILGCYFKGTACPSSLYIGLATSTPTQGFTSASTTLMELALTYTGYTRYAVANAAWTASANLSSNNTVNNTSVATWTAGVLWNPVTAMFVSTVASGTGGVAIAFSALSTTRTLQLNDVLNVTYTLTLQ